MDAFLEGGSPEASRRSTRSRRKNRHQPPEVPPEAMFGVGTGVGTGYPKQLLPHRTAEEVDATADRFQTPGPGSYAPTTDARGKSVVFGAEASAHTASMYTTAAEWDLIRQTKGQRAISPASAAVIATSSFAHTPYAHGEGTRPVSRGQRQAGTGVWGHAHPKGAFFGSTARPWQAPAQGDGVPGPGSYAHADATGLPSGVRAAKRKVRRRRGPDGTVRTEYEGPTAGRSVDSTKRNAPGHSFGSAPRMPRNAWGANEAGPAPGDHQHADRAVPSLQRGARRKAGGKAPRSGTGRSVRERAAEHPIGRGVGALSDRRRAPGYSFGRAAREGPRNRDRETFPAPGVHQGPGFNSSIGASAHDGRPDTAPDGHGRTEYDDYSRYPSSESKAPTRGSLSARERVVGHTPAPTFGRAPRGINPGDEDAYVMDPSASSGVRAARASKKYYDTGPAPGDHTPQDDMQSALRQSAATRRGAATSFGAEARFAPSASQRDQAAMPGPGAHDAHLVMASGDPHLAQDTTVLVPERRSRHAPHPPSTTSERYSQSSVGRAPPQRSGRSMRSTGASTASKFAAPPDGAAREYVVRPGHAASSASPSRGRRPPAYSFGTSTREHPFLSEGREKSYGSAWKPRL